VTRWVVVGAGAAGCVVAGRLAARPDDEVVLVEAGAGSVPGGVRSPSYFDALAEPGWTFPGPIVRGRGLGGSSAINGMVADPDGPDGSAVPSEPPGAAELGPVDRALLAAATDSRPVALSRRHGTRVTAADAFLDGVAGDRLVLVPDADVVAVVLDGRRAAGVALGDGTTIDADRVVLCAGAIGTPAILLRSGIAGPDVGTGLRNHPGVPVLLQLRPGTASDVHGLVTGTALRRGDVQVLALNHLGPEKPGWAMLLVVLMTSSSRGSVRLDPSGSGGEPVVEWSLDPRDRARLARAALVATGLTEHEAFQALVENVAIGDGPAGVFHWSSTCALGRVLDERGAVRGHTNLYVADASAFADLPAANLYVPTIRQAARLVGMW
jgi:choline dehydrogenase/5-(hydroxymethyl)furfural/furfural oxidase